MNLEELEEFKKQTGHNNPAEMRAWEQGYADHEELMMKFIENWNGERNSAFGNAMYQAYLRLKTKERC